jgi:methionyl-tRNA formyltransferase
MGSPDFALPTLEMLARNFLLVGVITQPDRPSGRGKNLISPAVKQAALQLGIPVKQPENLRHPDAIAQLKGWSPDLIVVAAFGQILRPEVLNLPNYGCLNVHGSLLPRWRGASPIQASILAGDEQTGVTIMKMDTGIDTGPILNQRAIAIAPNDTYGTLSPRIATAGAKLLLETLPSYISGKLVPQPQSEEGVTYARMLKKEDGLLDFSSSAVKLVRQVRAMNPWPGAFFNWNGASLKVHQARVGIGKSPGMDSRLVIDGNIAVGTGEGILILEIVQPPGKKPMLGKAFLSGARNWLRP